MLSKEGFTGFFKELCGQPARQWCEPIEKDKSQRTMRSCSAQSGVLLGRTATAHRALARARQPTSRARAVRQGNVMCFLKPVQQSAEELQVCCATSASRALTSHTPARPP